MKYFISFAHQAGVVHGFGYAWVTLDEPMTDNASMEVALQLIINDRRRRGIPTDTIVPVSFQMVES